jgi:hypothetical protein
MVRSAASDLKDRAPTATASSDTTLRLALSRIESSGPNRSAARPSTADVRAAAMKNPATAAPSADSPK